MHAKNLIDSCADLLTQVLRFEHPADAVLSKYFRDNRRLGPRERATVAETAFNVLRQKNRYEMLARTAVKGMGSRERRMAILAFAGAPDFLQTGLNQDEKTWLAECRAINESEMEPQHRHNLPLWLATKLQEEMGEEAFWKLANSLNQSASLDLRVNSMIAKREAMLEELRKEGLKVEPTPYSPWGLRVEGRPHLTKMDAFTRGAIEVQDEGSQLLALLLAPKRGEMVVDFCAGAGGKTLALGAQMRSTGRLYAMDVSAKRLDALKPRLARSGLSNVHPVVIAHERDERIKRLYGKIDRVLVDAPCSGLGTLRRNPDLKWRQTEASIAELREKQAVILASAAKLLKPGGRLVYATCSILNEENEAIADAFSLAHPDFALLDVAEILQNPSLARQQFLRLWPHEQACDGFFAAVWQKA